MSCIDFLSENDVSIETWINDAEGNEKVRKILQLWFTLNSKYNQLPWCQFPDILNEEIFYPEAKLALEEDAKTLCMFV